MAPVIPTTGKQSFMAAIIAAIQAGANNAKVHLFKNNYTPIISSLIGDFTEANFGGYAAIAVPLAFDHGIDGSGNDVWYFNTITFTATGASLPQVIYGFWVDWLNPLTAMPSMLWAQKFDAPFAFINPGDNIPIPMTLADNQG